MLASLAQTADPGGARDVAKFFEIVRSRARLLPLDRVVGLVPHLDAVIEAQDDASETGPLDVDAVSVLTVHRAKGLEFDTVYLTGLVDGRFPARARPQVLDLPWSEIRGEPAEQPDRLSEERRLFYVAMTRARNELWLTFHETATARRVSRRPSPFIAEAIDGPPAVRATELDPMATIQALGAPVPNPDSASKPDGALRAAFSFSELETYLDCPERYRLRHVVGLPASPHHALAYGRAMHQAVAAFHLSRRAGKPLTEEELLCVFQREWSPEGFLSREHEEHRYAQGKASLLRFREEQLSQEDTVVAVERPFTVDLDGIHIKGRIDRLDCTPTGTAIVDYKSSDVRDQGKADTRARDSLQLQAYTMAFESENGSLPDRVQLHFLDSGVVGTAAPDRKRLDKAKSQLKSAAIGIRDGRFHPKPDAVSCGYCPYRQICGSSAA
jgi:DNA helicase-2/ATP-dependent DNA helicase PcrA